VKTLETNHGGNWFDRLNNRLAIDVDRMKTLFAWASDVEGTHRPDDTSLFWNGVLMFRLCWPLGIWLHVKPTIYTRIQAGVGYKLNGRLGLTLRVQSDESAARGTHGPNLGQATGWARGTA
jgi:hypothetical protein